MSSSTFLFHLISLEMALLLFKQGDADFAYKVMTALQSESQHILHVVHLVSSTKSLILKLRDDVEYLMKVKSFCKARNVDIPKINTHYVARQGRAQHQEDNFTIEHHRVNIFYVAIDCE